MRLDVKMQLFARSERVKGIPCVPVEATSADEFIGIDFHPTEPWILTTLYSGMELKTAGLKGTNADRCRPCEYLVL